MHFHFGQFAKKSENLGRSGKMKKKWNMSLFNVKIFDENELKVLKLLWILTVINKSFSELDLVVKSLKSCENQQ